MTQKTLTLSFDNAHALVSALEDIDVRTAVAQTGLGTGGEVPKHDAALGRLHFRLPRTHQHEAVNAVLGNVRLNLGSAFTWRVTQ